MAPPRSSASHAAERPRPEPDGASAASGSGSGSSGANATPAVSAPWATVEASLLLRLDDPALEAAYWQEQSADALPSDAIGCLLSIFLAAYYLICQKLWSAPARAEFARASMQSAMLAATLAQLALLLFARPAYRRRRVRMHIALRALRLTGHVWCVVLRHDAERFWGRRFVTSDPRRTLWVAMVGPTLSSMAFAFINPSPAAVQPAFAAAVVFVWCTGWLPASRRMWEGPKMAAAMGATCEHLRLWLLGVDAAAIALVGAPATTVGVAGDSPTPRQCSCLLQSFSSFLMLLAAIVLPGAVHYAAELSSKRQLLRARGLALHVRVPLLPRLARWLSSRGVELAWSPAVVGPGLTACALLLLWIGAEVIVLTSNPACRCAAGA
ncbi:hypothetical protein Rsub_08976 [Raphidocelis subcapitata]|uniref:Uncharacterized protein n=1 Tax=Raphidocelis subcapitata TaxID=307507 RepID=A0A2V0PDX5_9CHLO|nr:hypothetical protein Rsub_08976 [Raphidocelis subcapitata]|eukprot:GBF96100.1 hypothetical protein Rsub_08976 [Raphidocelis subcapitata]